MHKKIIACSAVILLVATIFSSSFITAQVYGGTNTFSGSSRGISSSSFQDRPSYQTNAGFNMKTYWPEYNEETCEARQDIILGVPPGGCQPAVVRSDLLAEQDVPVFCEIDALKINPLIDIERVRNIRFTGEYPPEVAGTGYHPSLAALRTYDRVLGGPLVNNIGYIVVILKRQPVEAELPESVNITLNAQIELEASSGLGVGRAEFVLEEAKTEEKWREQRISQSFWGGRYFVRLEGVDDKSASVSIYDGEKKISSQRVTLGEKSREFYLPGGYCRAGLQIAYDEFVSQDSKARLEIVTDGSVDVLDVVQGQRFLDDRCVVSEIKINEDGVTGSAIGSCRGKKFELKLGVRSAGIFDVLEGKEPKCNGENCSVKIGDDEFEIENNELYLTPEEGEKVKIVDSAGKVVEAKDSEKYKNVWNALKEYKKKKAENPEFTIGALIDRQLNAQTKKYFDGAISDYRKVAGDYPSEKGCSEIDFNETCGETAIKAGIKLAETAGADKTLAELINQLLDKYPENENYENQLNQIAEVDYTDSGEIVEIDGIYRSIRLVSLHKPETMPGAVFYINGKSESLEKGEYIELREADIFRGKMILEEVGYDSAKVGVYCTKNSKEDEFESKRTFNLKVGGQTQPICSMDIRLSSSSTEKAARIRLLPYTQGLQTQANFTVGVGIEKRAIKLTPEKTLERIENLNKTIEKWERISEKLGKVVTGLKTACFATAALLTFKNFLTGLSGEALARQDTMKEWRSWCSTQVGDGKPYASLSQCYSDKANEIDSDVAKRSAVYNSINQKISQIQQPYIQKSGLFGQSVDEDSVRKALADEAIARYGSVEIDATGLKNDWGEDKKVTVNELLTPENIEKNVATTDMIRQLMINAEMQRVSGLSDVEQTNIKNRLKEVAGFVDGNMVIQGEVNRASSVEAEGWGRPITALAKGQENLPANIGTLTTENKAKLSGFNDIENNAEITHTVPIIVGGSKNSETGKEFGPGTYILGLKESDPAKGTYTPVAVWLDKGNGIYKIIDDKNAFVSQYGIGHVIDQERLSYHNEIVSADRKCRYYETEPYRGMPAIIPFDYRNGWYAATKQTLPVFGGIGAFDSSGRVTSFWVCNAGENGRIEIETGFGDDLCQQINLNTGQPLGYFPGMDDAESRALITKATRAISDASSQYGNSYITVAGQRCEVGPPSVGKPGTECQDFMSPKECLLMFNVCDPVVCPSSRCDLGGKYPVSNVVQTGIIGSVLLCLPNIKEGVIIPVCLTGIKAGIDGWISIMRNHRDCLQESLDTGQMVGICDEIYSIYLCEFFWNQVAPFVKVLIPKILEMAYGQGVRGGAEYLTVQGAWQNMENSVEYFTQSYAVNSLTAFSARAGGDLTGLGGEFCKSFYSMDAPSAFETLIEPDSPVQFHAWFDERRFTDATVPATSQYKVFYHIYAGNDQGVFFSVYLKSPPEGGYYETAPMVQIASDFIPREEYASETVDITAPSGYKELCVRINGKDECGFQQVSTSFAVDYLRDSWIKDELERTDITTEEACISGSSNLGALINPNIQAGAEEALNPQIYNRGVVRICATENPGLGTEPERFINVGYCGDRKVGCWLDKTSVNKALGESAVGMKNETLEVLEDRMFEYLQESEGIYAPDQAVAEIKKLRDKVSSFNGENIEEGEKLIAEINGVFDKLFYSHHKAQALMLRAGVKAKIAEILLAKEDAGNDREKVVSGEIPEEPEQPEVCESGTFTLEDGKIKEDGKETKLTIKENGVWALDKNENEINVMEIVNDTFEGRYVIDITNLDDETVKQIGALDGKSLENLEKGITVEVCEPITKEEFVLEEYNIKESTRLLHYRDINYESDYTGIWIFKELFGENLFLRVNAKTTSGFLDVGKISVGKIEIDFDKFVRNQISEKGYSHLEFLNGKYIELNKGLVLLKLPKEEEQEYDFDLTNYNTKEEDRWWAVTHDKNIYYGAGEYTNIYFLKVGATGNREIKVEVDTGADASSLGYVNTDGKIEVNWGNVNKEKGSKINPRTYAHLQKFDRSYYSEGKFYESLEAVEHCQEVCEVKPECKVDSRQEVKQNEVCDNVDCGPGKVCEPVEVCEEVCEEDEEEQENNYESLYVPKSVKYYVRGGDGHVTYKLKGIEDEVSIFVDGQVVRAWALGKIVGTIKDGILDMNSLENAEGIIDYVRFQHAKALDGSNIIELKSNNGWKPPKQIITFEFVIEKYSPSYNIERISDIITINNFFMFTLIYNCDLVEVKIYKNDEEIYNEIFSGQYLELKNAGKAEEVGDVYKGIAQCINKNDAGEFTVESGEEIEIVVGAGYE